MEEAIVFGHIADPRGSDLLRPHSERYHHTAWLRGTVSAMKSCTYKAIDCKSHNEWLSIFM